MTSIHFLGNIFLISTGVWMCLTENLLKSPVCDEESVYNFHAMSCLRLFNVSRNHSVPSCVQYMGGEHGNETGSQADVDYFMESFLRDYLRYVRVPMAAMKIHNFIYSLSAKSIATLLIQLNDCVNIKNATYNIFVMLAAEFQYNSVGWKMICDYDGSVLCQANGTGNATEESGCPSNVTLESVSESNATFYLTPGETKTQVRFSVYQPCNNMTSSLCRNPTTKLDEKIFLVKPTTQSVLALEPSTRYRVQFKIDGYLGRTFVCNETVDFTTNEVAKSQHAEESRFKSEVIGLSVILACSLCGIVVLAILYCRLRKLIGQDNTGLAPARVMPALGKGKGLKEVAQANMKAKTPGNAHSSSSVGISQTPSNARNANKPASKGSNSEFGAYTNVQVMPLNYDATDNKLDDHVYEMT